MKRRIVTSLMLALLATAFSACEEASDPTNAGNQETQAKVVDVEPSAAAEMVASGEVAVLDVRTPQEFEMAHIDGAKLINIQAESFDEAVAELDQSKPYLVHCAAGADGGRSRRAVEALKAAGASKIYHLNGGINAWMLSEYPVKKKQ